MFLNAFADLHVAEIIIIPVRDKLVTPVSEFLAA
jgi:hypothetical protein